MDTNEENLFKAEGYALMAAAFEVYNQLGPGFLEEVYREALEIQLASEAISYVSKPRLNIRFKEHVLKKYYEADWLVNDAIIVELKAVRCLAPEHEAQLLNELKASRMRVGLHHEFWLLSSARMVSSSQFPRQLADISAH